MGDDASSFGAVGSACGALGEPCCASATQARPILSEPREPRELLAAAGASCNEGIACVMSVCERPAATDLDAAGGADAKPAGEADTGAASAVHPVVTTLTVGGDHACVLRGGKMECWGENNVGQLGIGESIGPQSCPYGSSSLPCSFAPVEVTGSSAPVDSIAAGQWETCVVLAGGTVACWGLNTCGELGDGTISGPEDCNGDACSTTPVVVPGLSGVTAVSTNGEEVCAVASGGALLCWGINGFASLSDGTADSSEGASAPIRVTGLTRAASVAVGGDHVCVLLLDGTIQCWGTALWGQLGNGLNTSSWTPVPVSNVTDAVAIAAGYGHTCALMADATVACWGNDESGQLGLGTTTGPQGCSGGTACAIAPVKIPGLSGVTAIAAGATSTCALLSDGTVRCWGDNEDGELGDGSQDSSSTPVVVPGLSGVTAIAMGGYAACALVSNGDVVCWGDDSVGQVGTMVTGPPTCGTCATTPVRVSGL